MSARDDLIALASDAWISDYSTNKETDARFLADAEAAVDAFAHELAEELRDMIGREDYPNEDVLVARYVRGWRHAAGQIDPEYRGE